MTDEIGRAIRESAKAVRAPDVLRERLAQPPSRQRPARLALAGAAVCALAAVPLLTAGGAPTVPEVAAAALHRSERAPTAQEERYRRWGWRAVGARSDEVDGRRANTVIYRKGDLGVHYTVVAGRALEPPEGRRRGAFTVSETDGATVVSWRREDGRTCVLASRTVDADGLLQFTAWD